MPSRSAGALRQCANATPARFESALKRLASTVQEVAVYWLNSRTRELANSRTRELANSR